MMGAILLAGLIYCHLPLFARLLLDGRSALAGNTYFIGRSAIRPVSFRLAGHGVSLVRDAALFHDVDVDLLIPAPDSHKISKCYFWANFSCRADSPYHFIRRIPTPYDDLTRMTPLIHRFTRGTTSFSKFHQYTNATLLLILIRHRTE